MSGNTNCSVMSELASSRFLNISLIFNLITSLIALPIFLWTSCKLWTGAYTQTFHKNLRVVIQMHLVGFVLHCYGRVVLHSLDLYNYHYRAPCDMIPDIYRCFVFRLFYNTGMWITTCTAIPIALERSIATYRKEKYEKSSVCLGVALALLHLLLAAVPLSLAYSNTRFDGIFMPYCSVYRPGHPEIAQVNALAAIGAQAAARVLFGYLFHVNKKFRDSLLQTSLSTRYQIEQNKNSMQCLKIYANTSTVFLFAQTLSFMWLISASSDMKNQHYLALMELNCQYPLYGMICVMLAAKKIHTIRHQISSQLASHLTLDSALYHDNFNKLISSKVPSKRFHNTLKMH